MENNKIKDIINRVQSGRLMTKEHYEMLSLELEKFGPEDRAEILNDINALIASKDEEIIERHAVDVEKVDNDFDDFLRRRVM